MSTAPWAPIAPDALRGSLFHDYALTAHSPGADPIPLDVDGSASLTFNEGWAPHVQLTGARCRIPADQATLDALDPRTGTRVAVHAGYVYPGGRRDVHLLADLALRTRPADRPANLLTLSAYSDEVRVQDTIPLGDGLRTYPPTDRVTDVVADLVARCIGATVQITATSSATLDTAVIVTASSDLWGVAVELADRIGAWLYVDGPGQWHLTDRPTLAGGAVHNLSTGPAGTLTETTADLSLTDWGNGVLLEYPDDTTAYAYATSGPFSITAAPLKVVKVRRRANVGTTADRQAAAASVLTRALSRGRGFTLTAPAAYWLRPGHTITAQLPTGPQERHLVSAVTFELGAGLMRATTRVPDDTTTTTTGA